jgi:hypothetical protein
MVLLALCFISLVYWIADRYLSPYDLNDILDGPLMAVAFTVFAVYSAGMFADMRDKTNPLYIIKAGIALSWLATGVWRVSRFLYAEGVFGKASIGTHDSWRGYMICLMVVAGGLHLLAVDMDAEGTLSKKYTWLTVAAVGLGLGAMILFKVVSAMVART